MAILSKQKYDPVKVSKLAEVLRFHHEKGNAMDYEIILDGLKVVRRTNDPALFSIFENFVSADTRLLEVVLYPGASNNNEKHLFTFTEEKEQGLSGIEIDHRIQEQVQKERKEWEFELLKKEHGELKEEVEELEKEVERLEKVNEDLINAQSPLKGVLGEFGSSFVESFVRRNPHIIKNIPGGEALAGLIETDNKQRGETPDENAEVTFQSKSNNSSNASLTEDQQSAIAFVDQLKTQFTKEEFDKVLHILQALSDDKSRIGSAITMFDIKITSV